jgi:hypothetical protein
MSRAQCQFADSPVRHSLTLSLLPHAFAFAFSFLAFDRRRFCLFCDHSCLVLRRRLRAARRGAALRVSPPHHFRSAQRVSLSAAKNSASNDVSEVQTRADLICPVCSPWLVSRCVPSPFAFAFASPFPWLCLCSCRAARTCRRVHSAACVGCSLHWTHRFVLSAERWRYKRLLASAV